MALIKLLYLDSAGFPTEHNPATDTLELAGLALNGDLDMNSNKITELAAGTAPTDAVNKQQLDNAISGLDTKDAARLATTADLGATFNSSGGAGGTGQFTGAPTTIDGVAIAQGDRILVKNQSTASENGIYVVTATTSTWDRASDFDTSAEASPNTYLWVSEGTANADTGWVLTTDAPITLNTTSLVWAQFNGLGQITAGDGLSKTGNTLDVNVGDGIEIIGDAVAVDLAATNPGLQFVTGDLAFLPDPAGAIVVSASGAAVQVGDGLEIASNSVAVDLAATNPGLQFVTGDLAFLPSPTGAISVSAAGAAVNTDGVTIQINGSNQLEVIGAGDANRVSNSYTVAAGGVTAGDPVYFSAAGTVDDADAANDNARQVFGVAASTEAAAASVSVVTEGVVTGVLTGATAGQFVYLAAGGGLTTTTPTGNTRIMLVGYAINATDLYVKTQYLGRIGI